MRPTHPRLALLAAVCFTMPALPSVSPAAEWQTGSAGQPPITSDTATLLLELDRRTAAAASARSRLTLPARIGIARVERGAITPIPPDEWASWQEFRQRLDPGIGRLSPVTSLVAQSLTPGPVSRTPHEALSNLRLAAAREHLDLVLLYEIETQQSLERTELTLLDATIVGAWVFPTHRSHQRAHASATLIEVASGLSHGSAVASAQDACSATLLGSEEKIHRQGTRVRRQAIVGLVPEVEALIARLEDAPGRAAAPPALRRAEPAESGPDRSPPPTRSSPAPGREDRTIEPPGPAGGASFWGGK